MILYRIQLEHDPHIHMSLDLMKSRIKAYKGYAFVYIFDNASYAHESILKDITFTPDQVNDAVRFFKSHNRKSLAVKIKHSLTKIN